VAWKRSDALLQAREEEEEDKGEKRIYGGKVLQ